MNSKNKGILIFEKSFPQGIFQIFDDKPNHENLIELNQVHGRDLSSSTAKATADGLIFKLSELDSIPAIKTADCLPILYVSDSDIALVHAGWRGLHQGIHIHEDLRAVEFLQIFVGASISAENFEVSEDFRENFPDSPYFSSRDGKLTFNLQEYALNQLRECFPKAIIEQSNICTYADTKFNSYRRNKTQRRNWNIFIKKDLK